ncbi:hypothetical protein EAF00_010478 [Botryotinia globosa]|nr:hypothetical protein EAF00_010478 [Botryotinia globosa]
MSTSRMILTNIAFGLQLLARYSILVGHCFDSGSSNQTARVLKNSWPVRSPRCNAGVCRDGEKFDLGPQVMVTYSINAQYSCEQKATSHSKPLMSKNSSLISIT